MARPLVGAAIWTDVVGNSGTRATADMPLLSCHTTERFEGLVVAPSLTLSVPRGWEGAAEIVVRRVVRLTFDDGTFDEYRITGRVDQSGHGALTVTAVGIIYDLAEQANLVTSTVSPLVTTQNVLIAGTPTACLTTIDGFAPAWFAVGTVTPTAMVDVTVSDASPLAAAIAVAEAAKAITGTQYELSARRNGTSGYYLDLTVYNSSATAPDIRTGKNLLQMKRDQRNADCVTRVVPLATDGRGIADNWWKVSAVSLNTYIDIQDINGGLSPLLEADVLNNLYVLDDNNGTHQITDSAVQDSQTARLSMASTTNIATGDWVKIVSNSSKDNLISLNAPTAQATYGVRLATLPTGRDGETNWCKNPDFSDWSSTDPADWTVTGTWTKDTTNTRRGGWSANSPATGPTRLQQYRTVYVTAGQLIKYRVTFYNVSAVTDTYPNNAWISYYDGSAVLTEDLSSGLGANAGAWWTWTKEVTAASSGARLIGVNFEHGSGGGLWSVDTVEYFILRSGTTLPADWRKGSNASTNWLAGINRLREAATPPKSYGVTLHDLFRSNVTGWAYDQIVHGGSATVTDSDLGETASLRLIEVQTNHLNPLDTKITFANRAANLTGILVGG